MCEPLIRCSKSSQGLRTGETGAIHDSDTSNIEAVQDSVKQRSISAGPCDIESIENTVLEDIRLVQFDRRPEPCPFGADVTDVQSQASGELALDRQVEALHVRGMTIVGITVDRRSP